MLPCASVAAAAANPAASFVAAFLSTGATTLAARGARSGDMILAQGNPALSSGSPWESAGGGVYYRKLTASDVAGTVAAEAICLILRGALDSAGIVSFDHNSALGSKAAPGFTRAGSHAGIVIFGAIYTTFTPTFSAPTGVQLRISHQGDDEDPTDQYLPTTSWAYTRLSPPNAAYVNGADFACNWHVESDAAGVPGNSQNDGGGFSVIELRSFSGSGSAPPSLPTGVLASGVWDDGGVWDDTDVWKDS